jgi:hypothetical protein
MLVVAVVEVADRSQHPVATAVMEAAVPADQVMVLQTQVAVAAAVMEALKVRRVQVDQVDQVLL